MENKWIFERKKKSKCKYRLFCLPYAGSGASLYAEWSKYIDDEIEVCPIQLPGRENRRNETLCSDVEKITSEIADGIADMLDKPFAIFGYSMGGILAFELARKLYEKFHVRPYKLFMSASSTFREKKEVEVSEMDEKQLLKYMSLSEGVPHAIMEDCSLWKRYEPIIKNDYSLIENYKFSYKKAPCDIIAFASKSDREVRAENIKLMKFFTPKFKLYYMNGNHFFIRNEYRRIGQIVSESLLA